ncbi:hypothetical protein G3864_005150 [Escherichia coli]|nr:hypothetical protein [Escherichia coli]
MKQKNISKQINGKKYSMGKNCHFYRRVIFNICCLLVVISKITERCKNEPG